MLPEKKQNENNLTKQNEKSLRRTKQNEKISFLPTIGLTPLHRKENKIRFSPR